MSENDADEQEQESSMGSQRVNLTARMAFFFRFSPHNGGGTHDPEANKDEISEQCCDLDIRGAFAKVTAMKKGDFFCFYHISNPFPSSGRVRSLK